MSSSRTAAMTCSSAAAGSAPGWAKTRMPSRNAISVGMEVIPAARGEACSASVSTLPKTMSGCVRRPPRRPGRTAGTGRTRRPRSRRARSGSWPGSAECRPRSGQWCARICFPLKEPYPGGIMRMRGTNHSQQLSGRRSALPGFILYPSGYICPCPDMAPRPQNPLRALTERDDWLGSRRACPPS